MSVRLPAFLRPRGVTVPRYLEARARGDAVVERHFHKELLLRNGVYRTTRDHRMDDILPLLVEAARAWPSRPVPVLDVACSMGVATVELHTALRGAGIECETCGTDLMIGARYVAQDDCGVLFDAAGEPLQADIGPWATPWRFRRMDRGLRPGLVRRARRMMSGKEGAFQAALREPRPGFRRLDVPLLHRSTENVPGLSFHEESLLEPRLPGPFALIRAANILNDDYFPPDVLATMVERLRERLAEGGLLVVARNLTGEESTRATWYRHRDGRLERAGERNGGAGPRL